MRTLHGTDLQEPQSGLAGSGVGAPRPWGMEPLVTAQAGQQKTAKAAFKVSGRIKLAVIGLARFCGDQWRLAWRYDAASRASDLVQDLAAPHGSASALGKT